MSDGSSCGCGCCTGIADAAPADIANRPGLDALAARIGTHASVLAAMQARLSSHALADGTRPLAALRTRARDDASIALLDAWATTADVLTFYQQRIVNEGYLRTATEARSLHALARLIGYSPRPGVAASVFLAYTIDPPADPAQPADTIVPRGARAQTVPGQDEMPQSFETAEDLRARHAWNRLAVRRSEPQQLRTVFDGRTLYLRGVTTRLRPGDPLLIGEGASGDDPKPVAYRVAGVVEDAAADRTTVTIAPWLPDEAKPGEAVAAKSTAATLIDRLAVEPSRPPASALQLPRDLRRSFDPAGDAAIQVVAAAAPRLKVSLAAAIAGDRGASAPRPVRVFAPRLRAGLFGSRVPRRTRTVSSPIFNGEFPSGNTALHSEDVGEWPVVYGGTVGKEQFVILAHEAPGQVFLDAAYDGVGAGDWVIVDTAAVPRYEDAGSHKQTMAAPAQPVLVTRAAAVQPRVSRADYGLVAETTGVTLGAGDRWISLIDDVKDFGALDTQATWDRDFQVVRNTVVYARSEELAVADRPLTEDVCVRDGVLELDELYLGLEPGRYVIVGGERADLGDTQGVVAHEVAMIAEVIHDVAADVVDPLTGAVTRVPLGRARAGAADASGKVAYRALAGDRPHSFVALATPLSYCYRRDTLRIHGNVVRATHGETRRELLGSGDGARAMQAFALRQAPVTWLAAPTPAGAESTLEVFVDDVRWHPATSFLDAAPTARIYVERRDAQGATAVVFGNGVEGARLPTGTGNVAALYRSGIGRAGNAGAGQISQLATRPLGVREVVNPLHAAGGADAEGIDQVRRNAPLAVMALDRLVSTRDHADFARTFAGIGKAAAAELSDGRAQVVHVTVAGADDIPIDAGSDLLVGLRRAIAGFGDPFQPVLLAPRELLLLVIAARVRIHPDHRWERVATDARRALLDRFGFDRRDLAQGAAASEVLAVLMTVPGVVYVDLDAFGAIPTLDFAGNEAGRPRTPAQTAAAIADVVAAGVRPVVNAAPARLDRTVRPAQLLLLSPDVPATLVLNPIP